MFQALNHEFFYDEARFCSARWPWRVCKNVPVWHLHAQSFQSETSFTPIAAVSQRIRATCAAPQNLSPLLII